MPDEALNRQPVVFEANQGQVDPAVKFLARGPGYRLYLTATGAVIELQKMAPPTRKGFPRSSFLAAVGRAETERARLRTTVVRMRVVGANPAARVSTGEPLRTRINYLRGSDPTKWLTGIPTFDRIRMKDVYPGIDLVYYGTQQRRLEYDFALAPGGDPRAISLEFEGAERVSIAAGGDLVIHTPVGELVQRRPVVYQDVDGIRHPVSGTYVLKSRTRVGFHVTGRLASLPLVIDPVLDLGPSSSAATGAGSAVDADGNTVIVGSAIDPSIAITSNPPLSPLPVQASPTGALLQFGFGGGMNDGFVAKVDASNNIIWATYFGGDGEDFANAVVVDTAKNIYVTGSTTSSNIPVLNAEQTQYAGGTCPITFDNTTIYVPCPDAFVAKFDTNGVLQWSTYFGGIGVDFGQSIAVDGSGNAYVGGGTTSDPSFVTSVTPTTLGPRGGPDDVFAANFSTTGALLYFTVIGGSCEDTANGIAVDATGNASLTGETFAVGVAGPCLNPPDFPTTANAQQVTFDTSAGTVLAFIVKLGLDGSVLYSSYQGAPDTIGFAVTTGSIIATGWTTSPNFPTVNSLQSTLDGPSDAFILHIADPTSTTTPPATLFSTYFGGAGDDQGTGIVANSAGEIYVAGVTDNAGGSFPTANLSATTGTAAAPTDTQQVFVTKLVVTTPTAPPLIVYSAPTGAAPSVDQPTVSVSPSGTAVVPGAGNALAIAIPDVKFARLDVKPTINPREKGEIPVVILSSTNFDATKLDLTTVTFGHTGTEKSLINCNKEPKDKNKDGLPDLTCHFDNRTAGFQYGDTQASLKGSMLPTDPSKPTATVTGTGTIRTVPAPKRPKR